MDIFWGVSVFSLFALLSGGVTFMVQRNQWMDFIQAWNEGQRVDEEYAPKHKEVYRYHRRRFRRRSMVSFLMGLVGVMLPVAWYFTRTLPSFGVFLWVTVIFLLVWIMTLGILDAVSTYFYYLHIRDDLLVHQAALKARKKQVEKILEQQKMGNERGGEEGNQKSEDGK
ncbi:MAG: hypothetical protein Q4C96_03500 [Planctomycetia bacterium]|nr:hypothetical protein [Planctomycetia bacterium]